MNMHSARAARYSLSSTAVFCLVAVLIAPAILAQDSQAPEADVSPASGASPVAYVYIANQPGIGIYKIDGYAAAADGSLRPVSGSPFTAAVGSMAVNGKYLFAADLDGIHIDSFLIGSNGGLSRVASTLDPRHSGGNCDVVGPLSLDHTGSTLYNLESGNYYCANNTYQSFEIQRSTGRLSYLGSTGSSRFLNVPVSFLADNVFAYMAACETYVDPNHGDDQLYGFERFSNGLLSERAISAPIPAAPHGYFYCPSFTAADPANHLAVALATLVTSGSGSDGPFKLATYTANSNGNLTTTSTTANMPTIDTGEVLDIRMSPSGKLLAVGGVNGLQIFHFNGGGPIIRYSGLLDVGDENWQLFWDNANHLYALGSNFQTLRVFTVTPTSITEAPGSPHSIPVPVNLIVQPK
jgi:hypothetical protein